MDFLKPEFCVFCVIIPGLLPFTLWAALRAFKNFPEIFVAAKFDLAFSLLSVSGSEQNLRRAHEVIPQFIRCTFCLNK